MILALALLACSPETPTTPGVAAPAPAPARTELVIKGSDSEVNVVQKLAEEFMKIHPNVAVSVTGGGSGTGLAALIDGGCMLANSSRDFEPQEKVKALEKNVTPMGFVFATDAVGVIVNPKNPVTKTDIATVGKVFRGEEKSWMGLGGGATPISLYGRQSNSGTYTYFKKAVVNGEYSADVKQMNGNAQIVEGVAADEAGIGYVAAGYVRGKTNVKLLNLVVDGVEIAPSDEAAVLSGKYPLARPLYQFMNGKPTGALKDFLEYEASDAGKAIIGAEGFYPVFPDKILANQALLGG